MVGGFENQLIKKNSSLMKPHATISTFFFFFFYFKKLHSFIHIHMLQPFFKGSENMGLKPVFGVF